MNTAPEASDRHRARRKARARQRRVAAWGVRVGAVGVGVVMLAAGLSQPVAAAAGARSLKRAGSEASLQQASAGMSAPTITPTVRAPARAGKRVRVPGRVRPVSVPARPLRKPVRAKPKPAPAPDKVSIPGRFSASVPLARKAKTVKGLVSLASTKPGQVSVTSLGAKAAKRLGGGLFAVSLASPGATKPVTVGLRVAGIKGAAGGSYSHRLTLAVLGSCPGGPVCPPRQLATTRGGKDWLSAPVPVGSAPVVVAAVADASGPAGDYSASQMSPAGAWAQGGSGGGFSYTLPVAVPPSVGGAGPSVSLSYSSQVTDARSTGANGQSSWVGEGWDYDPGYIGQTYVPCIDNGASPAAPVGDVCWASPYSDKTQPAAVLHLGGRSVPLVWDAATGWRVGDDDGWRVRRMNNAPNGTAGGWYWRVDDLVGNQYW